MCEDAGHDSAETIAAARDNEGFVAALGPEGFAAALGPEGSAAAFGLEADGFNSERFAAALGVKEVDAPGYDDDEVADATASNLHHAHSLNVDALDP